MKHRGAGSLVLSLAMLLQGCAGLFSARERLAEPAPPVTASVPPVTVLVPPGRIEIQRGRPGFVIGAPHGSSDSATDLIGRELARLTGFSLVVATGFSHLDADGRRFNVNRPTESVPGTAARLEGESAAARRVYLEYRRRVEEAAQGPLRFYVEVHGNGRKESAGRVEIATVGLSRDEAWRLKTLLELIRDARLGGQDDTPRLEVWVESHDPIWYTASAAKQSGVLATSERALHIELPKVARTTYREAYTQVLADFLAQSAALLVPPGR
jgi:hypothetical protein